MIIKYIKCPVCGKQLMNQNYWTIVDSGNQNEFYCDECNHNIIIEDNDGLTMEEITNG
jgi:hypothetical protein